MRPYASCIYFCKTWYELTLWLITFTLTHGAVVGHQWAQSWAHLFRSHNQDTSSGLSSWVLSVRVWRDMKNTIRGLFTVLLAYWVLPMSDEPPTMVTAGQRSQWIHVHGALGQGWGCVCSAAVRLVGALRMPPMNPSVTPAATSTPSSPSASHSSVIQILKFRFRF